MQGLSLVLPKAAGVSCLLVLLLFLFCRRSESHTATRHPNLLLSEIDIAEMKKKIAGYAWARKLYGTVEASANEALSKSVPLRVTQNRAWDIARQLRDLSLVYLISGDAKYAEKVRQDLLALANRMDNGTLVSPQWQWSHGIYGTNYLWAYDKAYDHEGWTSADRILVDGFLKAGADACMNDPRSYKPNNKWAWAHAYATAVGYFYGIQEYITYGIDAKGGFKDILQNHVKDGFWNEATGYGPGYGMACMTIMAEATLHNSDTDLYGYTSPSGNSMKTMFDGYLKACYPDGVVAGFGNYGSSERSGGWSLYGQAKWEIAYKRYRDPDYAWVLSNNPERSHNDHQFWGHLGLTHGVPILPSAPAPAARSGTYPEYGVAMLMAKEGPDYWDSGCLAVFARFGGNISHAHRDQFGIVLHGLGTLLEPDLFMDWDYGTRGGESNPTRWSASTVAHNTVMVDRTDTGRNDCGVVAFQDLNESIKVLVLASPGGSAVHKSRTLGLTREYLIDVFELSSDSSHTYDWVNHQYGSLSVSGVELTSYDVGKDVGYGVINTTKPGVDWIMEGKRGDVAGPWEAQFREEQTRGINLLFSETDSKTVMVGRGPYAVSAKGTIDTTRVPLVIVRKTGKIARFVVLHDPFEGTEPRIASLKPISRNGVEISCASFTDYFFWSDTTSGKTVHADSIHVEFEGAYAYVRVEEGRIAVQEGDISRVRLTR